MFFINFGVLFGISPNNVMQLARVLVTTEKNLVVGKL
jgi:hypothetical protein